MLYKAANRPGTESPEFEASMDEARNRRFWSGWMRDGDVGVVAEDEVLRRGDGVQMHLVLKDTPAD
jgi:hypothetical protein